MARKAIVLVKAFSENVNSSLSNRDPRGRVRPYFYENPACAPKVNDTVDCVLPCGEKQLVMVLNTPLLGNVLMLNFCWLFHFPSTLIQFSYD